MAIPQYTDVRRGPARQHQRNLPHWEEEGAAYFVTFRLADSLPKVVQSNLDATRRRLDSARSSGDFALVRTQKLELARFREQALDNSHGACTLKTPEAGKLVQDTLLKWDVDRYDLYAWSVMPNHVHALVCPNPCHSLHKILHSWKSFTAKGINRILGREGTLWQSESFDHLIRSEEHFHRFVAYTLANPSKAGLTDWPWVGSKPIPK